MTAECEQNTKIADFANELNDLYITQYGTHQQRPWWNEKKKY